jgi:hypothetical protein
VKRGLPFALLGAALPTAASACTWCVSSAFGDRTFSWPYLGLLVAPFVIGSTIAAVLWLNRPANYKGPRPSALDKEMT